MRRGPAPDAQLALFDGAAVEARVLARAREEAAVAIHFGVVPQAGRVRISAAAELERLTWWSQYFAARGAELVLEDAA